MITLDTKIITVYDGAVEVNKFYGEKVLIYSWNPLTKLATVTNTEELLLSKGLERVLEVGFDSGLKVKCSVDHSFFVFRGYLVQARNLQIGQSIRAFSGGVHERDGHIRVHGWVNGKAKHQYTARMIWEYFFGKVPEDMIIHHKDFIKTNNNIKNLELLSNSDHNRVHYNDRIRGKYRASRARNHKVVSVELLNDKYQLCDLKVNGGLNYIIADDQPISGDFSGIVSSGFVEE